AATGDQAGLRHGVADPRGREPHLGDRLVEAPRLVLPGLVRGLGLAAESAGGPTGSRSRQLADATASAFAGRGGRHSGTSDQVWSPARPVASSPRWYSCKPSDGPWLGADLRALEGGGEPPQLVRHARAEQRANVFVGRADQPVLVHAPAGGSGEGL